MVEDKWKRKWRENEGWQYTSISTSRCFHSIVGTKPKIFVLGENSFPNCWSQWARAKAARRRLYS